MQQTVRRRLPVGAEPGNDGTHFRVWAPKHESVRVVVEGDTGEHELAADEDGYFSGTIATVGAGTRYRFRLGDDSAVPDPASRFQPDGPHGPSMVVDPDAYSWSDDDWQGPAEGRQVVYEMHIGTFTRDGTWTAAAARLPDLAALGISIVELMPVAEFPGRYNWGYDGVAPFAPSRAYGTPDDLRAFVDHAHALGLGVILDVVYNHVGPDGCYLQHFADEYFSTAYSTDWGPAINFDGAGSAAVREYFIANIEYWVREFHVDGFRFDATQSIYDASPRHILADMVQHARSAAEGRRLWLVGENEPQDVRLVRPPDEGGFGMDAVWNDDFHHTAMVTLTGSAEAYYTDYAGTPQELISCARHGFLYQGQHYLWQKKRRGTPTRGVPTHRFVNFIQNHDQVANSAAGRRIHELAGPAELRAMTALMLLMPGTPLLLQGQEFAASAPFLYFADHRPELAATVRSGRREFLTQFRSLREPAVQERLVEPASRQTFERVQLDHGEREANAPVLELHRDLIRLARTDPVLSRLDGEVDGAVLGAQALALRWWDDERGDRLLIVNFGADLRLHIVPEPLLAPPAGARWSMLFASEQPQYGGRGAPPPELASGWLIQARSAVLLAATRGTHRSDRD
ncbi:MAG TPA: malto-oligosyltrehalose trehalohydrolase [Longimicrobiales bacterium]